jgi:polyferredoxin
MQPERIPLSKVFDVPFLSLDGTSIEMASLLFLFLAVLLATRIRRRRQLVRHLVQAVSVVFFFYVVYSCLGVFGMIRNSFFGLTLFGSVYTESFYWMSLPVLALSVTVLSGPVFCGWICPTGTIQELAGWLRTRVAGRPGKPTRRRLAWIALASLLFLALVIRLSLAKEMFIEDSSLHWAASLLLLCYLVTAGVIDDRPTRSLKLVSIGAILFSVFSHTVITSPVHFAFTSRNDPASALATLVITIAAMFVLRAWCRYLCPWGYLLGRLNRFARVGLVVRNGECNACGKCNRVCDVEAIDNGAVRVEDCQLCYACVDACPEQAIEIVDRWQGEARERPGCPPAPACGGTARIERS